MSSSVGSAGHRQHGQAQLSAWDNMEHPFFLVSLREEAKVWSRENPSEHGEAAAAIPQAECAEGAGPGARLINAE